MARLYSRVFPCSLLRWSSRWWSAILRDSNIYVYFQFQDSKQSPYIIYMSQTVANIIVHQTWPKRANSNTLMAHAGLNKRINIFNLCKYWWGYWRKSFQVNIKTCHYFILYTLMMLSTIFQNSFSFLVVIPSTQNSNFFPIFYDCMLLLAPLQDLICLLGKTIF